MSDTTKVPVSQEKAKAVKVKGEVHVDRDRCKGCGFCVEFCPTHALELDSSYNKKGYHPPVLVDPDQCSGCDLCGLFCPDFSIYGVMAKRKVPKASGDQ
jgi:2-oxoglutarate ferredoxin oxidoreductase subunit delta